MSKKTVSVMCRECFLLYKNFIFVDDDYKAENFRIFTCPGCLTKDYLTRHPSAKNKLFYP